MIEHDQLDKCPGLLRIFPLRRPLAGAQAHDCTADADALARFQGYVPDQTIALVQQAEHRDPVFHCRDTGIGVLLSGGSTRLGDGTIVGRRRWGGFALTIASCQRQGHPRHQNRQRRSGSEKAHVASGVHA